jgi:hypothetical protein
MTFVSLPRASYSNVVTFPFQSVSVSFAPFTKSHVLEVENVPPATAG